MEKQQDKVLEVKNLRISFKTNGGTVKAVRGISFSLYKGKTLAIVGESGSGKSVTSKAILGILANNKIIEDGQIIFEGKDLLKLQEEQFTKIRGVKISMIFQDPLSSLNPIMKVGKQLTEAMLLKSKATVKNAKKYLKKANKILRGISESEFKVLQEYASTLTKEDKSFNLEDSRQFFIYACETEFNKQQTNATIALDRLNEFKTKYLADDINYKDIDVHAFKKDLHIIKNLLSKSLFSLASESDDTIEVYYALVVDLIAKIKESEKLINKTNELLVKNNVSDVYDLPASVRAQSREVLTLPEEHVKAIKNLTDDLINHLIDVCKPKTKDELNNVASRIEINYFKTVIDSKGSMTKAEGKQRALELLTEVGINEPERRYNQYPFEFSGGMRQRIVIAIALSSNPEVLICDEPTTALDVTIQAQILELIQKLKVEKNLSIIFITHDLGVVANMADDIAVMYAGKIVEYGTVYDIFYDPRHPYTWALLGSMPDLKTKEKLNAIPGTPPNMLLPPKGDAFALRNKYALKQDFIAQPPFFKVSDTHFAATWLLHPQSVDVEAPKIVVDRIQESLKESSYKNCPNPDNYKNSILNQIKKKGGNN